MNGDIHAAVSEAREKAQPSERYRYNKVLGMLRDNKIISARDLVGMSAFDLRRTPGFGPTSMGAFLDVLPALGMSVVGGIIVGSEERYPPIPQLRLMVWEGRLMLCLPDGTPLPGVKSVSAFETFVSVEFMLGEGMVKVG